MYEINLLRFPFYEFFRNSGRRATRRGYHEYMVGAADFAYVAVMDAAWKRWYTNIEGDIYIQYSSRLLTIGRSGKKVIRI